MTILINFFYRHGKSQNTEAATDGFLKNFNKFIGKCPYQSRFFNKVAGLRPANLFKKRLQHKCFSVNFVKFLRTNFLQATVSQNSRLETVAGYSCLVKSCSENIWKIARSIYASDCKFHIFIARFIFSIKCICCSIESSTV